MKEVTLKTVRTLVDGLESNYDNRWKSHHQEINKYIFPRRGRFLEEDIPENDGDRRHNYITNSEGVISNNKFAAGMQGGLTSQARKWFKLTIADPDLADDKDVKEWFENVERRMYYVLGQSTFYDEEYEGFVELGAYCTSAMYVEADFDDVVWFNTLTCGQYFIRQNKKKRVDTLVRKFYMYSGQIVEEWGEENCPEGVKADYKSTSDDKQFLIVHAVFPNPDYKEGNLRNTKKKFRSVYYVDGMEKTGKGTHNRTDSKKFLSDSGYSRFPYVVTRFAVTGSEEYGRGPGTDALNDIKGMQKLDDRGYKSLDLWLTPPMVADSELEDQDGWYSPRAISYVDMTSMRNPVVPVTSVTPAFGELNNKIEKLEYTIRRHFYVDIFSAFIDNQDQGKTAYEVSKIETEKLSQLGSAVARFNREHIEELIDLVYMHMDEAGLIPPPPRVLAGAQIEVEHISPLAQAQKAQGAKGIESTVNFVQILMQAWPEARHKLDVFATINAYEDMIGSPVNIIKTDEEAQEAMDAEAQAMAQQNQLNQAMQAAQTGKVLSETPTGGDTMLEQYTQGLT